MALLGLVITHHYIIHSYFFDMNNLFSHEALEAFLLGLILGLAIKKRGKKRGEF